MMSALDARRLTLGNELIELDRLAPWIEGLAEPGMSPRMSLAVQVCLEEIVANVIMYGAINDERLQINVELERAGEMLLARISDNGQEFDPTQAPPPTVAASIKDAKVGNLGIHLARSFANGIDYERRGGRNQLTLRFIEPQAVPLQYGPLRRNAMKLLRRISTFCRGRRFAAVCSTRLGAVLSEPAGTHYRGQCR